MGRDLGQRLQVALPFSEVSSTRQASASTAFYLPSTRKMAEMEIDTLDEILSKAALDGSMD